MLMSQLYESLNCMRNDCTLHVVYYGQPYCQLHHAHIRQCWASIGVGGTQRKMVNFRPTYGLNLQDSNMMVSRLDT